MKRWLLTAIALFAVFLAFGFGSQSGHGLADSEATIVSALGVAQVNGQTAFVEVTLAVPRGLDEHAVAEAALGEQGARPVTPADLQSANYTSEGLVWDQFADSSATNNFVTQNYNPAKDPTSGNGEGAVTAAEDTWTNVSTSSFVFQYGGSTTRCPSLVRECPGPQAFDGKNDVGWLRLGGCCTLGVTWYSTSIDEADTALNTGFRWHAGGATNCTNVSGRYDAQTVLLHELGHVVGLGHSNDPSAVMYATYSGAHCTLSQDDRNGVTFLYP